MIEMKLQPHPFEAIHKGTKKIEIRLHDEKRKLIKVGDTIRFTHAHDSQKFLNAEVIGLVPFSTFKELFEAYPPIDYGGESSADYLKMYKYYSPEDETKYGVLAIVIRVVG